MFEKELTISTQDLQYLAAANILGSLDGKQPTDTAIKVAVNRAKMLYEAMYLTEEK